MATFQILEDQENCRIAEPRQKPANMAGQQKRSVLGVLDNRQIRRNPLKEKQPLGESKIHNTSENISLKQIFNKHPPPVVPVAQFEAFKVYEDIKDNNQDSKAVELKNSKITDHPLPKKEWLVQDAKLKLDDLNIKNKETNDEKENKEESLTSTPEKDTPMSIEKLPEDECVNVGLVKTNSNKDLFFENEEYRSDIYLYLREHEMHNRPKPGYMKKQPDITYNMRTILVDWLVEVAQEYKLQTETLYLAINYIDRFLSYMSVVRAKLQLVGTAAMYIAAKYEEIYPPDVIEFVYITDDTYTKKQVLRMEHLILKVLSFDLSVPTPLTFITAMSISGKMPEKIMYLAMYLSELSMLETDPYLNTLPSVIAASAIAVARYTFKMEPWSVELKSKTGYDIQDLKKTMEFLYLLFCKAPTQTHQAIQEKYNCSKYLHVSRLGPKKEDIKLTE